ncbi:MAG: ROK family protein [Frankia sp.]
MSVTGWAVVGLDNGGTCNNATVMDGTGRFLLDHLLETPSLVTQGPADALRALVESFGNALEVTGTPRSTVRAVGLDTPGPASADGVISSLGATNFIHPQWHNFDVRAALETALGLPVVYNNDGNAAALYAHHTRFGTAADDRSSVAAIVGTGLGGGVVFNGRVVKGAAGMAGELGHVNIPMAGLLAADQAVPACNCGFSGDAESVASLTGIERNLLPYWLSRYPTHPLASEDPHRAAKLVRGYAEDGDPMSLEIFSQQAQAIGRLFTIIANVADPDAYFVGGGVVETEAAFREWFLGQVRANTALRDEQRAVAEFALVPDLDMAGARGSAIAAAAGVANVGTTATVAVAGR